MKPNFALNLSHDGISLLHRAKAGWISLGSVSLDAPDLTDQLRMLRRNAADLESGGLTTKLVIPNSQVLYADVDAPGPDTASRIAQIRDGLVGLTPYDVNDLVFDWRPAGRKVQVAVVARDTLREAEAFATEHRFNPVSFVAMPEPHRFEGEPFFGPSEHAATLLDDGESVEPDETSLTVPAAPERRSKASRPRSARAAAPSAAAATETPPPPPAQAGAKPPPEAVPPGTPAPPKAYPAEPDETPEPETVDPAPEAAKADAVAAAPERPGAEAVPPGTPAPPRAIAEPTRPGKDDETGIEDTAPADDETGAEAKDTSPDSAEAASSGPPAEPSISFASRRAGLAETGSAGEDRPQSLDRVTARFALEPDPAEEAEDAAPHGPERTPMAVVAPHTADLEPAEGTKAKTKRKSAETGTSRFGGFGKRRREAAPDAPQPKTPAPTPPPGFPIKASPASKPASPPQPSAPPRGPVIPATKAKTEAEALTVFGERGRVAQQQRGKPRYLGVVLTLGLLVALGLVAIWSTWFMSDATSGWFGTFDEEITEAAPPAEPADEIAPPEPVVSLEPQPVETPGGAAESPGAPAGEAAPAIAVDEPAQPAAPEDATETAAAPSETGGESGAAGRDAALLDMPGPAADAPPDGAARTPPRTERLSPDVAEARYAATGIWQLAPEPSPVPPTDRTEDVYIASIDPVIHSEDAFALPQAPARSDDNRPASLTPPAPLGTEFDFDARGLVRATPEGAISPDGILIYQGPPPQIPGPRPADLEVPVDETRLPDERLREIRPALRPDGLEDSNERARLGGFTRSELAEIRPALRPASAQAESEADSTPTELAVVTSRAPGTRPANFTRVVRAALQSPARAQPETRTAAVAPTRVAPRIPTRASVAKQATVENAIKLSDVNLIGVYGSPSRRRALVRLPSGRYVKVKVGDRVDGGQVAAIGDNELRYVKRGRNITLTMPRG